MLRKISISASQHQGSSTDPLKLGTYDVQLATSIMHRHVSAFTNVQTIGKELIHIHVKGEATLLKHASLTVLGKDHV